MSETLRVLVHTHPNPANHFEPQRSIWEQWKNEPNTHLHSWPMSPFDIAYLDTLEEQPCVIVVGGQKSWACILDHLMTLADHPRIQSGKIKLCLSRSATYGDYLEDVAKEVSTRTGIAIQIVE